MKKAQTTTAALALALSAFLAHGAAAQNDTRSAGTPNPNNSTAAKPMNDTATSTMTTDRTAPNTYTTTTTKTNVGPLVVTGKVVTKNADSVVILNDAGERVTVYTDASSTLPTASWAMGDRVTVNYTTPTAGRNHADTILMAPLGLDNRTATTTTTADTMDTTNNTDTRTANSTLPRTASKLPLTLLLGSAAGAMALGLHLARRNG